LPAPDPVRLPDRWDVERAVKASDLPPIARHLLLELCTCMDAGTAVIPYRWSPSLTGMSDDTGWNRRTVIRWLDFLEQAGWLSRLRPTVEDARKLHRRTAYTVIVPVGLVTASQRARDSDAPGLVTGNHRARDSASPELGTQGHGASDRLPHIQTDPEQPDQPDLTELVIRLLNKETGVTVDAAWAAKTVELITTRPGLKNPRAYLIRTITTDPLRWLPTSQPPPFDKQGEQNT
jgi:hypothetical protein